MTLRVEGGRASRRRDGESGSRHARAAPVASQVSRRTSSALNGLLDQAGSYRRLACGLALVPVPLAVLGMAVVGRSLGSEGEHGFYRSYGAIYLGFAGACLWMAIDLVRRASILDRGGWPVPGAFAVATGLGLLVGLRPPALILSVGPRVVITPAVVALLVGLAVLIVAEWWRDRLLLMVGRWVVVGGATLVGGAAVSRAVAIGGHERWYAAGLFGLALVLIITAYFEARVLIRGAALFRVLVRR